MTNSRLNPLTSDELGDEARKLYGAILNGPRGKGFARKIVLRDDSSLTGPFDAWLRTPQLGHLVERVGMALRSDTVLSAAAREVAILVVANAWKVEFEWLVHLMLAKRNGISEEAIAAIQKNKTPKFVDVECQAAHGVALALVNERKLSSDLYESAKNALGVRALVELVTLIGFYQMVSGMLESFRPPEASIDLAAASIGLPVNQ